MTHTRNAGRRAAGLGVITATALAVAITSVAASVQAQETRSESARMRFDIAPGPVAGALRQFSERTGIQFVYSTPIVDGLISPGVAGDLAPSEALSRLLAGTALIYRFTSAKTVTFEKAPNVKDSRVLGPVRVEGSDAARIAGMNGSTDPTATEGTKSYTSGALSIASKTPQSIKDTPQSVSVITQQRMQDQNITDFTALLNQATGISVVTGDNPLTPTFYSRGFAIQRVQVDGGAPVNINSGNSALIPLIDVAMFDHAEVLRGADGLFNGYGAPGGTINLVRKRPLDHAQLIFEGQAGSWSNYRTTVDATGPLGFDGRLRGRAVLAYQDQDYFYDIAASNKTLTYGVIEYDLLPDSTLSLGFSQTRQDTVPFIGGLPRYENGADLKLGRSDCLCFPWNRHDFNTDEIFARFEQGLTADWSVTLNVTDTEQRRSYKYGYVGGVPVNPATLLGPALQAHMADSASSQQMADLTLSGSFELFGHRQLLVAGANYAQADGGGLTGYTDVVTGYPIVNVFDFDARSPLYQEPSSGRASYRYPELGSTQWGAYATLRLTVWEPLHLNVGLRFSHFASGQEYQSICSSLEGCVDSATGAGYAPGDVMSSNSARWRTDDWSWPPSWSLVYDITDTLSIYGSYADIYQEQSTYVDRSGRAIDPLTGSNIEGGLKWSRRDGRLNATVAVYRIEQEGYPYALADDPLHGTSPDGIHECCYSNEADRVNLSQGVDLEVTGEIETGWQLAAGYTYNKNEQKGSYFGAEAGKPLQSILPRHLFKLWSSYQFQEGEWLRRFSVGGGLIAQTKGYYAGYACVRFTNDAAGSLVCDYDNGGMVPYEFTQGFYAVLSARLTYQLDARWNAAMSVNNLTDRAYYQTVGSSSSGNWYGDPRNFMLTLRGRF